jgi:hypothetical protein
VAGSGEGFVLKFLLLEFVVSRNRKLKVVLRSGTVLFPTETAASKSRCPRLLLVERYSLFGFFANV